MAEYIEREAAISKLKEKAALYEQNFCREEASGLKHGVNAIIALPAADVAPVVWCKDCKWHRETTKQEKKYLVEGVLICASPDATDDCWNAVFPDHFCSFGERRTDENQRN